MNTPLIRDTRLETELVRRTHVNNAHRLNKGATYRLGYTLRSVRQCQPKVGDLPFFPASPHGGHSQVQLHTPGTRYRLTFDLVTLYTPLKTPQNTPVQTVLT